MVFREVACPRVQDAGLASGGVGGFHKKYEPG